MEIPESKSLAPDRKSIIKTVCKFYKIEEDQIFSGKRGTERSKRMKLCIFQKPGNLLQNQLGFPPRVSLLHKWKDGLLELYP